MISENSHSAATVEYTREFRVVRVRSIYGTRYLAIHEVAIAAGKINWVADMPPYKTGGSISELQQWHRLLASAFDKPVIDAVTLKELSNSEFEMLSVEDNIARTKFERSSFEANIARKKQTEDQ